MTIAHYRTWWAEDPRLTGTALSLLLLATSRPRGHEFTQTEAQASLQIGQSAWQAAKRRLITAGFLVEVRDRYPINYQGKAPRGMAKRTGGGQKRFRLFFRDAEPGTNLEVADGLFEFDRATETFELDDWPVGLPVPGVWQNRSSIYLDELSWREFRRQGQGGGPQLVVAEPSQSGLSASKLP